MTVDTDRFGNFVDMVIYCRSLQKEFRRSQDPRVKTQLKDVELILDRDAAELQEELLQAAAELVVEAAAEQLGAEGGAL